MTPYDIAFLAIFALFALESLLNLAERAGARLFDWLARRVEPFLTESEDDESEPLS